MVEYIKSICFIILSYLVTDMYYMVFHRAKFKSTNKDIYIFGILKLNV